MLPELHAGMQITHRGIPLELLYLKKVAETSQIWFVRPLFVSAPDREQRFEAGETVSHLHVKFLRANAS
jgi:hypothetical protein